MLILLLVSQAIDDPQITRDIERAGVELQKGGKTVAMADLLKGLSRETCDVDLPEVATEAMTAADLYKARTESTLIVSGLYACKNCGSLHGHHASGVVLTAGGVAATNYHVVDHAEHATIVARTWSGEVVPVLEVLAASKEDDVAIVRIGAGGLTPAPVRAADVGETVRVISHPSGEFYFLSEGIVSRYGRHGEKVRMTISAPFAGGSSGAPVFDARGNVAGLVSATRTLKTGGPHEEERSTQMVLYDCVPAERILKLIERR